MSQVQIFHSNAPWVVDRSAMLEDALQEFDAEVTRQKPWMRLRYASVLERLQADFDLVHVAGTPLAAMTHERLNAWLQTQSQEGEGFVGQVVADFEAYLLRFGWV